MDAFITQPGFNFSQHQPDDNIQASGSVVNVTEASRKRRYVYDATPGTSKEVFPRPKQCKITVVYPSIRVDDDDESLTGKLLLYKAQKSFCSLF